MGLCAQLVGKVEYNYLGLDSRSFTDPVGFFAGDTFTSNNPNVQSEGWNYLSVLLSGGPLLIGETGNAVVLINARSGA